MTVIPPEEAEPSQLEHMVDFAGVVYRESELPEAVGMTYEEVMRARDQKAARFALYAVGSENDDLPFSD